MKRSWMKRGAWVALAGLMAACGAPESEPEVVDSRTQQQALGSSGIVITADNMYELYVNGTLVGSDTSDTYEGWFLAESYDVPLSPGDVIAVKATDLGGIAGVLADVYMGGSVAFSTGSLNWKCSATASTGWSSPAFSDAAWPAAEAEGPNGSGAWGTISGISSSAQWIWVNNPSLNPVIYCRAVIPTCGGDLARSKPVTSSGYWSPGVPSRAVDGDRTTTWQTNLSTGAWLQVDLGAPLMVNRTVVSWGWDPNFGTSAQSAVEASLDGSTWSTLATFSHIRSTRGTEQSASFASVAARYVRFRATQWNGGWGYLDDLQLYGPCTTCGANLALGKAVSSSGYWAPGVPSRAVDGDRTSTWQTNLSTGAWLQVDLGQTYGLGRAVVAWGWDPTNNPSADSAIEASVDGSSWTTLQSFTQVAATRGSFQSAVFPSTPARYVRFRATRWSGGWGYLNELQVCAP